MTLEEKTSMNESQEKPAVAEESATPQRLGFGLIVLILIAAAGTGWFIYKGISARVSAESALRNETKEAAAITVAVTHPKAGGASQELPLPGNTQAFIDAPIYARTNGYLKRWYADIGTRVTSGQLLAEIEAPEIDHQLQQARADLETAQANLEYARTTAARWQVLLKTESVSQQDTDQKVGDLNAKKAMVDSAASNVKRLEDLQAYEKVYSPFDGVVTVRNTDVGALISADTSTPGRELFHVAATDRLRVFVSVPEEYERAAKSGATAGLTLTEFPGRTFTGTIVRNASSIDPGSRTLLVEVDVNNASGELLPGAYVTVHLKLQGRTVETLTIPANTLLFRSEGLRVAVVRNGKAQLTAIQIGRDFGEKLEVTSGLKAADQLIVNPPDSLVSGADVRVITE
jgi:RND family efflux transporter MFP subunit